jgi:hypothetical protein
MFCKYKNFAKILGDRTSKISRRKVFEYVQNFSQIGLA